MDNEEIFDIADNISDSKHDTEQSPVKSGLEDNEKLMPEHISVLDELETLEDENEKFWKTPSSSRMVRGGTMMLSFDIIISLFFTVYIMQLSRAPTEDSSLLAIIDTLGLMLRFIAYLGFTGAGAKFMSEYRARDKEMARIYAKSAAKYNMWVTGFPLIGIALYLLLTKPTNEIEFVAYLSLFIIILFDRLTSNISIYIIGAQRYDLFTYAYYIPYAFMYIAAIITYPLVGVKGPLISFAVARVVIYILMSYMMGKATDYPYKDLWDWKEDYGLFWKLFKFNFLYSLANLAFSLLTTTLLISGGSWLGILTRQEITALYTISTFSNILMNLFEIVGPIMVSVSEASGVHNKKLVENYVMIALKFPLLMSIAVLTFFIVLGPEMIEIFNGKRWITMGMVIMAMLMPAYAFGSFASKYDNILAGIGRPETVIFPWFVGIIIALGGMFGAVYLPTEYLVDKIITYKGETLNYGISLKFIFSLGINSLGLIISGIWVVRICLKVLGVKVPRYFIYKPVIAAVCSAVPIWALKTYVPLREILNNSMGEMMGGVVFTFIMVGLGLFLYLTVGLLFDVMNLEDGKFWKHIAEGMGPVKVLMKPLFKYCGFLLRHQIKRFVHEPIKWIIQTDKKTLEEGAQFKVKVMPISFIVNKNKVSNKGVVVKKGDELEFALILYDLKVSLYNLIFYAQFDHTKKEETLVYRDKVDMGGYSEKTLNGPNSAIIRVKIPDDTLKGAHELTICLEAYEEKRDDIPPEKLFKKGLWSYFDYRMRWLHEEQFFIDVEDE